MPAIAKFVCTSRRTYRSDLWDSKTHTSTVRFVHEFEFQAVTGNSPENDEFFASTPSGSVKLTAIRDDLFVPGETYYLQFTEAPA